MRVRNARIGSYDNRRGIQNVVDGGQCVWQPRRLPKQSYTSGAGTGTVPRRSRGNARGKRNEQWYRERSRRPGGTATNEAATATAAAAELAESLPAINNTCVRTDTHQHPRSLYPPYPGVEL